MGSSVEEGSNISNVVQSERIVIPSCQIKETVPKVSGIDFWIRHERCE